MDKTNGEKMLANSEEKNLTSYVIPNGGRIPVAFVIGKDAEVLDFAGPLEVFAGPYTEEGEPVFKPYFVASNLEPVTVGGGMKILPDCTFADAPAPKIIVIPAMSDATAEMIEWIRVSSETTDVTMSVCNGAFVLAETGLLNGKPATAHHGGYFRFAGMFPQIHLKRGVRFVETGNLATSGGVSSGIDLTLRVVERYIGREQVLSLIDSMEYQGTGWLDPNSNLSFARLPVSTAEHPVCPLCRMETDSSIQVNYRGNIYYFCSDGERAFFEQHPEVIDRFLAEDEALTDDNL